VATVVHAADTTSQLVHVPSSATASGITTDAQVVQMQVGTLYVTASPAPTRSRERVAQAAGFVAAVVNAADTISQLVQVLSWATASGITTDAQVVQMQVGMLRGTASPEPTRSRERDAQAVGRVATVVHAADTTSQLVHVPSSATASGITTDAQVVQIQVGTLCVTASPAPTRSRKRVAQAIGRVATVVHAADTKSQLVRVPSSATASGITTDAQVVQMQVGMLRGTASPAPRRSRDRVAQVVGRGVAGADAAQGACRASGWSWRRFRRRGAGSAAGKRSGDARPVAVI